MKQKNSKKLAFGLIVIVAAAFWWSQQQDKNAPVEPDDVLSGDPRYAVPEEDSVVQEQSSEAVADEAVAYARPEYVAARSPYGSTSSTISLHNLDLSRPPSEVELRMAGQLGSALTPYGNAEPTLIEDPEARAKQEADNLLFGRAMQLWNEHDYDEAVELFEQHRAEFPDSPWAGEAELHMGCEAQFNGRWEEAEENFGWITENVPAGEDINQKAQLRRSVLLMERNQPEAAIDSFAQTLETETDSARRTYVQSWIRQVNTYKQQLAQLRNCGSQAIAKVLELKGDKERASEMAIQPASGDFGYSLIELVETARDNGLSGEAIRGDENTLETLPLPFIAHYSDEHFVVVSEREADGRFAVYDPRLRHITRLDADQLAREWSGLAVIFESSLPEGVRVATLDEMDSVGGCCGIPRYPEGLGDTGNTGESPANEVPSEDEEDNGQDGDKPQCPPQEPGGSQGCGGLPRFDVNMLSFNVNVTDRPLWYSVVNGPDVYINLTYNSQDSLNQLRPFGDKWLFNYASYAIEGPGGNVLIVMPNGRGDEYVSDGAGGFISPSGYESYQLERVGGYTFDLTLPGGSVWRYDVPSAMTGISTSSLLVKMTDKYGGALDIVHDSSGAIDYLQDADGRYTYFEYYPQDYTHVPSRGLVSEIFVSDDAPAVQVKSKLRDCTFTYNDDGLLAGQVDMGDLAYGYEYAEDAYISKINYPGNRAYEFLVEPSDGKENYDRYPDTGESMWESYRVTVTDPMGGRTEYFYNGWDGESYVRDPLQYNAGEDVFSGPGTKVEYTRVNGRTVIWRVVDVDGNYSENGNFHFSGQPRTVTDRAGNQTTFTYNDSGMMLTATDELGRTSTYEYVTDGPGKDLDVRRSIAPDDPNTSNPYTTTTYYYLGENGSEAPASILPVRLPEYVVTEMATGKIVTTKYEYDATRDYLPTKVIEGHGQPGSFTAEITRETTYYSSGFGNDRIHQVKVNGEVVKTYTYDDWSRFATVTDAAGVTVEYEYDDLNRVTRSIYERDGQGVATDYTEKTYDCCTLKTVRDRNGKVTEFFYDGNLRRVAVKSPEGRITQYIYDAVGNLITLVDPAGNRTRWAHDEFYRVTEKTHPDGSVFAYSYDIMGNLTTFTNARGQSVQYQYDDVYNLKGLDYNADDDLADTATGDVQYTYDALNRRATMVDRFGTTTFTYDKLLLDSVNGPLSGDTDLVSYDYDELGRLAQRLIGASGTAVGINDIDYDSFGRVSQVDNALGVFDFIYGELDPGVTNVTGMATQVLFPEVSGVGRPEVNFDYHPASQQRRLAEIEQLSAEGTLLSRHGYAYDDSGNITAWTRKLGAAADEQRFDIGYDDDYQLTSAMLRKTADESLLTSYAYDYDAAGNRTSATQDSTTRSWRYNEANQLVEADPSDSATAFAGSLDEAGEVTVGGTRARMLAPSGGDYLFEADLQLADDPALDTDSGTPGTQHDISVEAWDFGGSDEESRNYTSKTYRVTIEDEYHYDADGNLTDDEVAGRTFEWDKLNRLTKITYADGSRTEFTYDGNGRRTTITEKDSGGVITEDNRYLWVGLKIAEKRSADGATVLRRYFGNGFTEGGTNYYYTKDHLGSIREVFHYDTNTSSTVIDARYDYDPYGNVTKTEGTGAESDFLYTGHLWHAESELYLAPYRAYDADLGRWISRDPIAENGGINLYAYVGNNPVMFIDPNGDFFFAAAAVVFTAVVSYEISNAITNLVIGAIEADQDDRKAKEMNDELLDDLGSGKCGDNANERIEECRRATRRALDSAEEVVEDANAIPGTFMGGRPGSPVTNSGEDIAKEVITRGMKAANQ